KNSVANGIALLSLASERRNVSKIGGGRTLFFRSRFDLFELVEGARYAFVPWGEPRSFNRYVAPANCNCACRAETEGLLMTMALSGPRPIVTRSSTSSYVVPLMMSFGILAIV